MAEKTSGPGRVTVANVSVPGSTIRLDAAKYEAMGAAVLAVLPSTAPGRTQAGIRHAGLAHPSSDPFPGGARGGGGAKMGQRAREAKGIVDREATKPRRWHARKARKAR